MPRTHQASLQPCELSIAVLETTKLEYKKMQLSSPVSVPDADKDFYHLHQFCLMIKPYYHLIF